MVETVAVQHHGERGRALDLGFPQCGRRISHIIGLFQRFEPPQVVGRDDGGDRLAVPVHDDPFAAVLGAPQQV